jgi:antitoxin YefM
MIELTAGDARANFYSLLDNVAETRRPVRIVGPRNNAVLTSEADWNAIHATLYLLSVPGMCKSICAARNTPARNMAKKLRW